MAKYRKKPVVIEAERASILSSLAQRNFPKLPQWVRDAYYAGEILFILYPETRIEIKTLEGTMIAQQDDMVICGVKGELYPCKPDIFEATYEMEVEG